jgi:hypothetical protein
LVQEGLVAKPTAASPPVNPDGRRHGRLVLVLALKLTNESRSPWELSPRKLPLLRIGRLTVVAAAQALA